MTNYFFYNTIQLIINFVYKLIEYNKLYYQLFFCQNRKLSYIYGELRDSDWSCHLPPLKMVVAPKTSSKPPAIYVLCVRQQMQRQSINPLFRFQQTSLRFLWLAYWLLNYIEHNSAGLCLVGNPALRSMFLLYWWTITDPLPDYCKASQTRTLHLSFSLTWSRFRPWDSHYCFSTTDSRCIQEVCNTLPPRDTARMNELTGSKTGIEIPPWPRPRKLPWTPCSDQKVPANQRRLLYAVRPSSPPRLWSCPLVSWLFGRCWIVGFNFRRRGTPSGGRRLSLVLIRIRCKDHSRGRKNERWAIRLGLRGNAKGWRPGWRARSKAYR